VEIWTHQSVRIDEYGNTLVPLGQKRIISRKIVYAIQFLKIGSFIYYVDQLHYSFLSLMRIRKEKSTVTIWSRFPLTILVACLSRNVKLAIIELHHLPNFLNILILKLIKNIKPAIICVISKSAEQNPLYENIGIPTAVLEMCVPESFIVDPELLLEAPIRICYLGKNSSSGNQNNLEFLIYAYAQMKNTNNATFELVGVEEAATKKLLKLVQELGIEEERIMFRPHMSHLDVSTFLNSVSIGLVPYEMNSYNSGRFPIKIAEYASKGIWIFATDNFAAHLKLSKEVVYTYKDGDYQDFAHKLDSLCGELHIHRKRNKKAIEFAKAHTYSNRARVILNRINSVKTRNFQNKGSDE